MDLSTRKLLEWVTSLRSRKANPKRLPISWVILFVLATYLWLTFSSTDHILSPKSPVLLRSRDAIFLELQNIHSAVSLSEDAVNRQLAGFERQVSSFDGKVRTQLELLRASLEETEKPDSVVHPSPWPPSRKKVVLIWGYYYTQNSPPFLSNFDFSHCRVPFCEWTRNRQRFSEADALWFHLPHYPFDKPVPDDHPPPRPTPNQVWIASSQEWESMTCSRARGGYDGYFNWTMSYKRDSDVWWPYGTAVRTSPHLKKPRSHWDRLANNTFHSVPDSELFAMLRCKYYFVLAFENGLCADYVSEKFWKIGLMYDAVPVVRNGMDREEMARMAPPGSYINAADFGGPKELSEYLKEVASNQTLYASFFEWKKDYSLVFDLEDDIRWSFEMAQGDSTNAWCKVCEKLHSPKLEPKTINFSQTWCHEERGADRYASEHSQCIKAEDLEEGFETVIEDHLKSNHTASHAKSP